MTRNVLVVGGAGFIGSHTVLELMEQDFNPVVYDNLSSGYRDAVLTGNFVEGELEDKDRLVETILKFDISSVIHFAALIEAGESVLEPLRFYRNNVASTVSLLEAMQSAGLNRLVFSSTAAVYGNQSSDQLLHESLAMSPVNPYGRTKAAVEALLQDVADSSALKTVALRYFNAGGADSQARLGERHDPETHLIPLVLQTAAGRREQFSIFGDDYPTTDGTCIRDYVHVTDLAKGHIAALKHLFSLDDDDGFYQPINLGTGKGFSVREVIEAVRKVTGEDFEVGVSDRRPGDPAQLVSDPGRAREILRWQPERSSLYTIIEDAWRYMRRPAPG